MDFMDSFLINFKSPMKTGETIDDAKLLSDIKMLLMIHQMFFSFQSKLFFEELWYKINSLRADTKFYLLRILISFHIENTFL